MTFWAVKRGRWLPRAAVKRKAAGKGEYYVFTNSILVKQHISKATDSIL